MTVTEHPGDAPVIGTRMRRREDPALLTGEARFTDDLNIPGALHMAILRSPYAHARITSIDVQPALALPGVVAAYSGADLADAWASPMPCAWPVTEDMKNPPHHPLADRQGLLRRRRRGRGGGRDADRGTRRARGHRGRRTTRCRRSPTSRTPSPTPTVIHDDLGTNVSYTWELHLDDDAVERAFADATHVVKERYVQQRLIPMAMEPRACAAVPEPFGGDITLYSATQIPHILKVMAAITLGLPEQQVRVVAPSVGGGFGSKLNVYADELLVLALAKKHGRPVRWVEERTENAQSTIHGRGQIQDIELAADADGKLLGRPGPAPRRHGRLPPARHPGHPAAGRVPLLRRLRRARPRVLVHVGLHHHDADRRVPRRRSTRGHLRHRAGDGPARRAGRRRPGRDPAAQLHQGRPVPVHRGDRAHLRLGQLRGRGEEGAGARRLRRRPRRAGAPARSRAARSTSASASPPTSRCAGWRPAGCWRR